MSNPTQQSLIKLKRLARYPQRERKWAQIIQYGRMHAKVTAYWASDKETRKSSNAGIVMIGEHMLKGHTRKQKIIARSSAEAELYAAALGASEAKGMVSLLRDLGYMMTPTLAIEGQQNTHRQGIGRMKHIDVAHLWLLDEVRSKRLKVRRVRSEDNVSDIGTKVLSRTVIVKHSVTLGYISMDRDGCQLQSKGSEVRDGSQRHSDRSSS